MKKKDVITVLLFNFFTIILLLISIEYFLVKKFVPPNEEVKVQYNLFSKDFSTNGYLKREPCGLNYKKPPIIIYGCSFAYGFKLKDNETFGYQLSELTKRPVYNFGILGMGIQHALFLLQNQNKTEPKPEYLIYVFEYDQIRRMYMRCVEIDHLTHLNYTEKNGKFLPKKDFLYFLKNTILYQRLFYKLVYTKIPEAEKFKLFKKYLFYIKKEADEKYPGIKLIFLYYQNGNKHKYLTEENLNEIRELGYDVINTDDLLPPMISNTTIYHLDKADWHPSAKAWEEITPKIVKIENL